MFLLVPAYPGSPGSKAVKRLCVCVCVCVSLIIFHSLESLLSVILSELFPCGFKGKRAIAVCETSKCYYV